ncbi:MAG: YdjY domain-containing protein [Verrucomicrobiota bacterium]
MASPGTEKSLLASLHRASYHLIVRLTNIPPTPRKPVQLYLCLIAFLSSWILAPLSSDLHAEDKADPKNAKASVKKIGENLYQLGDITFNGKTREIRFPVTMNLEKGLLEYVLVTDEGKIHESLLSTKVRPAQLQIALKLCHYTEGVGDIFDALYPEDEKKGAAGRADRGSALRIAAEWTEKSDGVEKPRRFQINELIRDLKTQTKMSPDQWIYSGSIIYEGTFIAESEGTLIAVYIDNGSLINSFRPGSDDDERWVTNAEVAPSMGTPITLILSPNKGPQPTSK